jgi:hypothetical protein
VDPPLNKFPPSTPQLTNQALISESEFVVGYVYPKNRVTLN